LGAALVFFDFADCFGFRLGFLRHSAHGLEKLTLRGFVFSATEGEVP
jgi:hypothetical protein